MFAPRSVGFSHRSRLPLSTQNNNTNNENENNLMSSKSMHGGGNSKSNTHAAGIVSKTPAGLRPARRAFGDISNNKSNNNNVGGSGKDGNGTNIVLKSRSSTNNSMAFTPRSNSTLTQPRQTLIPKLVSPRLSLIPKPKSASKKALHQKPSSTQLSLPRSTTLEIPLPKSQLKPPASISVVSTQPLDQVGAELDSVPTKLQLLEPVEDVERPAGRLWIEQQQQEPFDDDLSTSSMDLIDRRTMWDDWRLSMKQYHDKQDEQAQDLDSKVQQEIAAVIHEEDKGLESLLDWVDGMDLNDNMNYNEILEDDWSEPASSILGHGEGNEDLLFEL